MPKNLVASVLTVSFLASALGASGCSMTYVPANGPRASLVIEDGKPAIMKNGEVHKIGAFGGELEDALDGDPKAQAKAVEFHDMMVAGLIETIGGEVIFIGGALTAAGASLSCTSESPCHDNSANTVATVGGVAAIAGLVLMGVGLATTVSAQPRLYDAINMYNDHIEHREGRPDAKLRARRDVARLPLVVVPSAQ